MTTTLPALDRLRCFLRPPGLGIPTVSTGGGYAARLLERLYGSSAPGAVQTAWEDELQRLRRVEWVMMGIPSDTGAGLMRGASFGPLGVREAYLADHGPFPKTVLDLGDVISVPQLLHDEMLSQPQIEATREALYQGRGAGLPVSPLSIAENAIDTIFELHPKARLAVLGGDHSVSWPVMSALHRRYGSEFGVLHFDAHTDLLQHRFGVKYCFATWAYHGMRLLKPMHFVQLGVRTSGKPKQYWMDQYPIVQIWAGEVAGREDAVLTQIAEHFESLGVKALYLSNDIDATDSRFASATGAPEENGLHPDFVRKAIETLGNRFHVLGGDVVEVAPPLSGSRQFAQDATCRLGADYLHRLLLTH